MIALTWVVVVIVALALFLRQTYSRLSKKGVNHLPVIPFIGNIFRPLFKLENIVVSMEKMKTAFPEDKVVGAYQLMNPVYVIHDADIIKKITIKDFDQFLDRRGITSEADRIFGRSLINLRGEDWKEMRSTLSPAFTSSKIRLMVPFIVDVGEEMIKVLNARIKASKSKLVQGNEEATDKSAGFATVEESDVGKKIYNKEWSDTDLVAQAVLFLAGGFDTVSTAMSFILHVLAVNYEVQEKLVQEIYDNDKKNNGNFDFQSIQEMKYLDMVVSGSRFALCEVMLYILLRKIKLSPCEKTKIPVQLEGGYCMSIADGGWVRLQIRD